MSKQRQADITRLKAMIASGRKVPNDDDKAFIRALLNPASGRVPADLREQVRPLVARYLQG